MIFFDSDGDGLRRSQEVGLAGWNVELVGTTFRGEAVRRMTTTAPQASDQATGDATGHYQFADLLPGVYHVSAQVPVGWGLSAPMEGEFIATLVSDTHVTDADFGSYLFGSVTGTAQLDVGVQGHHEPWEPGLAGWDVLLTGTDGRGHDVRRVTTTIAEEHDAVGDFTFVGLTPGNYQVELVPREAWVVFDGAESSERFQLASGETMDDVRLYIQSPYRCDLNGDGHVDAADAQILFSRWGEDDGLGNIDGLPVIDGADAAICFAEWTAPVPVRSDGVVAGPEPTRHDADTSSTGDVVPALSGSDTESTTTFRPGR